MVVTAVGDPTINIAKQTVQLWHYRITRNNQSGLSSITQF